MKLLRPTTLRSRIWKKPMLKKASMTLLSPALLATMTTTTKIIIIEANLHLLNLSSKNSNLQLPRMLATPINVPTSALLLRIAITTITNRAVTIIILIPTLTPTTTIVAVVPGSRTEKITNRNKTHKINTTIITPTKITNNNSNNLRAIVTITTRILLITITTVSNSSTKININNNNIIHNITSITKKILEEISSKAMEDKLLIIRTRHMASLIIKNNNSFSLNNNMEISHNNSKRKYPKSLLSQINSTPPINSNSNNNYLLPNMTLTRRSIKLKKMKWKKMKSKMIIIM